MPRKLRKVAVGFTIRTATAKERIKAIEWAYLAGFYDGEGTITVTKQKRKGHEAYIQLRFVISNTDFALLRSLQKTFGGAIHVSSVMKDRPKWKQIYMWHGDSKITCLPILKGMLPYLRYKNREVELAIEYWEGVDSYRSARLQPKELRRRASIADKIKMLPNRRNYGPVILPAEIRHHAP